MEPKQMPRDECPNELLLQNYLRSQKLLENVATNVSERRAYLPLRRSKKKTLFYAPCREIPYTSHELFKGGFS